MPPCPLCNSDCRAWHSIDGYPLYDCISCGHRFAVPPDEAGHVQQVYGDDYFTGGGAGYTDYLADREMLLARGRWYASLIAPHASGPSRRLLEIGAAAGFTLAAFREQDWECFGVEPNRAMAEHARSQGLNVTCGTSDDLPEGKPFDLVVMLQVVAHFTDVATDLANVVSRLRPGGLCLVETWDRASMPARLLNKHWHEYSPPSVLHWFSRKSLDQTMQTLGLTPLAGGRPRKSVRVGHARSLLAHKAAGGSLLAAAAVRAAGLFPANWIVPYPSLDLFWRVYQKPITDTSEEQHA